MQTTSSYQLDYKKPSMMDPFNDYTVFKPERLEGNPKSKVSNFFILLHNLGINESPFSDDTSLTLSPIADFSTGIKKYDILSARVANFMLHQACITRDPISYLKGEGGNTVKRRVFDFVIGGSIAALAETLASATILAISSLALVIFSIVGVVNKCRGEKDPFEGAMVMLLAIGYSTLSLVKSVSRIVPVAGAFLGYGVGMASSVSLIGTAIAITKIQECASKK